MRRRTTVSKMKNRVVDWKPPPVFVKVTVKQKLPESDVVRFKDINDSIT